MTSHKASALGVLCTLSMIAATACSPVSSTLPPVETLPPGTDTSGASGAEAFSTAEDYYAQKINWTSCDSNELQSWVNKGKEVSDLPSYQCATISAPLDWEDPGREAISLRLAMHKAKDGSKGALFYNPGGPGGAATTMLADVVTDMFGSDLVDKFNIVAMDPRGVGASQQVRCFSDEEKDEKNAGTSPEDEKRDALTGDNDEPLSDEDLDDIVKLADEQATEDGDKCLEMSGDLPRYVDTVSAATDFDMARALLGQKTFTYLGYSYGTFLGATYADLFPDKVGHIVLDGAVDPTLNFDELSDLQMRGFEASLTHWIEDCQAGPECPLTGEVEDGVNQLSKFLTTLAKTPLSTTDPNRPLTQNLALTVMISTMYDTELFPLLKQGLQQAMLEGDGSLMLRIADLFNDRDEDGHYMTNSDEANMAINNLDYGPSGTPQEWRTDAEKLKGELPILGSFAGFNSAGLGAWPMERRHERGKLTAKGAPPILVIGTTHDPATPYSMAQGLAKQLESGILISWEGWNHTAYSADGSRCIAGAVETYLLKGTPPEDGLMCTD